MRKIETIYSNPENDIDKAVISIAVWGDKLIVATANEVMIYEEKERR